MFPVVSDNHSPDDPKSKPKDLNAIKLHQLSLKPLTRPCTWIVLTLFLLQILLLYTARSGPKIYHSLSPSSTCLYGHVYVYDLPLELNTALVSARPEFSDSGFGPPATNLMGIIPQNLVQMWSRTDQFALEILYHNRILNYKCRTRNPELASAYYIPFYAGLALGNYLWSSNYSSRDRDRHAESAVSWLRSQPSFFGSDGWDHFTALGRITWDFRRSQDDDWGSRFIYISEMRNVTRLLIERNPWDYFDVGVPYPTGFHPRSPADVTLWQSHVRRRVRGSLFSFAGARRARIKKDFRGILFEECWKNVEVCKLVDCSGSRCMNYTSEILESFLDSNFCLQPRGDSFTRRSIFDCMVAGSIPVFFWKRSAYYQYELFLPKERGSYSVYIDREEVKSGRSIREVLEKYGNEEVVRMREKVIEYIPRLVYARPSVGLGSVMDAFDVGIEGVLKRVQEQKRGGFKW